MFAANSFMAAVNSLNTPKKISYLDVTFIYYEKCPTMGVYITIGLETIGLITLDI